MSYALGGVAKAMLIGASLPYLIGEVLTRGEMTNSLYQFVTEGQSLSVGDFWPYFAIGSILFPFTNDCIFFEIRKIIEPTRLGEKELLLLDSFFPKHIALGVFALGCYLIQKVVQKHIYLQFILFVHPNSFRELH